MNLSLLKPTASSLSQMAGASLTIPLAVAMAPAFMRLFQTAPKKTSAAAQPTPRPTLFSGAQWFEPGQTGVTFTSLFSAHLSGETHLTIVDPHVKTFRQIRILGEFLETVAPAAGDKLQVQLITSRPTGGFDWEFGQAQALVGLKDAAIANGIILNVSFDESIHDRWIESGSWTILLGKGLDIWDARSCARSPQRVRTICKKFAVTYIRTSQA